jgi:hypothetical protein
MHDGVDPIPIAEEQDRHDCRPGSDGDLHRSDGDRRRLPEELERLAVADEVADRSTLNTSRIDAAPSLRAARGSPSRIAWVSMGMIWTPCAWRAPITRSKSCFGRRTSASSAILWPILFQPASPTSQDPKCIEATTTPLPRAMASSKW